MMVAANTAWGKLCSNLIDASALDSLDAIVERLAAAGVQLHLSEVKGPVMDQLKRSDFLQRFGGQVFISQFQALKTLAPQVALETLEHGREAPHAHPPAVHNHG